MKVFLDANIIVSVLNREYPLFSYSARILSLAEHEQFQTYTSPVCLAIAFYFAEKKCGAAGAKKKIEILTEHINIASMDKETVLKSIQDKKVNDFEDGLEYYSAVEASCKCLITQDAEDFHFARIEVLSAQAFLNKYVF